MDYAIPIQKEIHGDTIPLWHVGEAMARKAASGFGYRDLHGATLLNKRQENEELLLVSAMSGELKVCDRAGRVRSADSILEENKDIPSGSFSALYVLPMHLAEWGSTRGDTFNMIDVGAEVVESGPTMDDGTKPFRSYVEGSFGFLADKAMQDREQQIGQEVSGLPRGSNDPASMTLLGTSPINRFVKEGEFWEISFQGQRTTLKHMGGFDYICYLLRHPNTPIGIMDLHTEINPSSSETFAPVREDVENDSGFDQSHKSATGAFGNLGVVADKRAIDEAGREMAELMELRKRLKERGAVKELNETEAAIEKCRAYLSSAVGKKGKPRLAGSLSDKVRSKISMSLLASKRKIKKNLPDLKRHLDKHISYARLEYFYRPDDDMEWDFSN